MRRGIKEVLCVVLTFLFVISFSLPMDIIFKGRVAGAATLHSTTLGNLKTGDRVIDTSWEWEYRTGFNYTGEVEPLPVTWIVAAKNHKDFPEHSVTLLSEGTIGFYKFDDSSRGEYGGNNWGLSGQPDAEYGVRVFLNETFYEAFSEKFKASLFETTLPNIDSAGESYTTTDKVFIPSHTEIGLETEHDTPSIGSLLDYFDSDEAEDRRWANVGKTVSEVYWTRSPVVSSSYRVITLSYWGSSYASFDDCVRPLVNMSPDVRVYAHPFLLDTYMLFDELSMTVGDLPIGSKVSDQSWSWVHRTGENYTGSGVSKPVTWAIIANDHYENADSHVTLFAADIIAKHAFDNSTNRGSKNGSNIWKDSGAPNATHGVRKFLNETFYNAISENLKNAIVTVPLPNKDRNGVDYETDDNVFLLSHTELGGFIFGFEMPGAIGKAISYFFQNTRHLDSWYWTRSPDSNNSDIACYVHNFQPGDLMIKRSVDFEHTGVRPAINICSDTSVAGPYNGVYHLFTKPQLGYGDVNGNGSVSVNDAILVLQHIVGIINIETQYGSKALEIARVSKGSGELTVTDAIMILQHIVGIITRFPVEG